MARVSVLDKSTALRARTLGSIGEDLALSFLERSGFANVQNLNELRNNFPFADIVAEYGGVIYAISVKTRNKYEARTNNLNARYKLGANALRMAALLEENQNAVPAWLAVQIDGEYVSAYFGTVAQLEGNLGIPMTPDSITAYWCLADREKHEVDTSGLKNTYVSRTVKPVFLPSK